MEASLLDLLKALSDLFAPPGRFHRVAFEGTRRGGWAGPRLAAALDRLLSAETEELEVAYVDHFLYSSWHPVLHLEASVQTQGHLCDEGLLARRAELHERMGITPPEGRCADHLASGLLVLAEALRVLALEGHGRLRTQAVQSYLEDHLWPQVHVLRTLGRTRPLHPVFEAGLDTLEALLEELRPALEGPA